MPDPEYALFDTLIGRCAIAWGPESVCLLQLPEAREDATRARVLARLPGAREGRPPRFVQQVTAGIGALLTGASPAGLEQTPLDLSTVPPFHRLVYGEARRIPPGQKLTYGELARRIGSPGSARAVGQALGRNPFAIVVPCHRVFAAGGKPGGFSASGGITTKLRLLALESPRGAAATGDAAFSFNPQLAIEHLRSCDARLRRLIDAVGPFRMELQSSPSVFGALAHAIVYQQLHAKAAASIFSRLCGLFQGGSSGLQPEWLLRASEEQLRSAGLSRAKLLALQDLARKTEAGQLPSLAEARCLDDETLVERLTQVRGIGRWTVEMLLMFRLGRPDVLPVDDFGVRKGFGAIFGDGELADRKLLARHAERWRPYRSVASWYLWRALELPAAAE